MKFIEASTVDSIVAATDRLSRATQAYKRNKHSMPPDLFEESQEDRPMIDPISSNWSEVDKQ